MAAVLSPGREAFEILENYFRMGGIAAIPTETVYGLAANAFDETAVSRVFSVKGRPLLDPLITHVASLRAASQVAEFNPLAEQLARCFWPGPLTLVLPRKSTVPDLVTAGLPTVAIRSPDHDATLALLQRLPFPLAAPSANPFGYISPTTSAHVEDSLGHAVTYILEGGPCRIGLESTIVDLTHPSRPTILRPGAITATMLHDATSITFLPSAAKCVTAPGQLPSHYQPRTPFRLFPCGTIPDNGHSTGPIAVVFLQRPPPRVHSELPPDARVFWLSENGDLSEVARQLFSLMRRLDALSFSAIFCELAPDNDLGPAINDRISRAAAPKPSDPPLHGR